ncbi:hypothetical protein [Helicobacter trogontum]|uniref:Septum formation initiator n=2 Tax=Helicobacter trogontum TaxID=50960 RepID=A0A4U8S4I3_9HELI|nr:hypothetical protein [Helicobacter trogontum]TLD80703.1 hypothetical protein LS81_009310 [Helicobacter trogontum]
MPYSINKQTFTMQQGIAEDVTRTDDSDMRISNDEKEELVTFDEKKEGIGKLSLFMAFFILLVIMGIFVPKIFISNNIYYISRDIARLNAEKELLYEERLRLKREIEIINNKHLMLELGAN